MRSAAPALNFQRFGLILFIDLLESIAEVCFKSATTSTGIHNVTLANFYTFTLRLIGTPALWIGVVCFLVILCVWLAILAKVDLSVAFPLGNTVYVLIPLLSIVVLHEHISALRWIGTAFVLAGGYLVSISSWHSPD